MAAELTAFQIRLARTSHTPIEALKHRGYRVVDRLRNAGSNITHAD